MYFLGEKTLDASKCSLDELYQRCFISVQALHVIKHCCGFGSMNFPLIRSNWKVQRNFWSIFSLAKLRQGTSVRVR